MIGLHCQSNDRPLMRLSHLMNEDCQPIMDWASQYLAASLGAPDDMVDDEMSDMVFVLIVHVDSLVSVYFSARVGEPFIPRLKDGGLSGPIL